MGFDTTRVMVRRQRGHALRETARGCTWDGHRLSPHLGGCSRDVAPGKEEPKLDPAVGLQCPLDLGVSAQLCFQIPDFPSSPGPLKSKAQLLLLARSHFQGEKKKNPMMGISSLHLQPWFKGRQVSSAPFFTRSTCQQPGRARSHAKVTSNHIRRLSLFLHLLRLCSCLASVASEQGQR